MSMFRDAFPIIYTEDLPAALTFYCDLLGFSVSYRFPPGDATEFVALGFPGGGLALAATVDGQVGAHGRPVHARAGHQFELCVYTDDVDSAVAELRRRGVAVLAEPADQPWGERMAYVADPDGHPVMITAPLSRSSGDPAA